MAELGTLILDAISAAREAGYAGANYIHGSMSEADKAAAYAASSEAQIEMWTKFYAISVPAEGGAGAGGAGDGAGAMS